jgi:beta-aspartyl-peptidase (threonine type)
MPRSAIIVHGGAWDIPPDQQDAHCKGCEAAAKEGYDILSNGGSSLDAVEAAIRSMESDSTFDAGRGAFLNADGEVELDAIIMEGDQLKVGAVAALQHILHPVSVARAVMERTQHAMLVGEGALRFARAIGMETVEVPELLTCRELERWKALRAQRAFEVREVFEDAVDRYDRKGTVGAVALDEKGTIAAATSTGGTPNKMAGRVGDSPLVGCGNYADSQSAGVSCTGWGESIMKVALARRVCEGVENGLSPRDAASRAINYLKTRVDGLAGVIVLDKEGEFAHAFNTPFMAVASVDAKGKIRVTI